MMAQSTISRGVVQFERNWNVRMVKNRINCCVNELSDPKFRDKTPKILIDILQSNILEEFIILNIFKMRWVKDCLQGLLITDLRTKRRNL